MLKLFCLLMISQLISNFTIIKKIDNQAILSNKSTHIVTSFKIRVLISIVLTVVLILSGLDLNWGNWLLSTGLALITNSLIDYVLTCQSIKTTFKKWFPKYKDLFIYLTEQIVRLGSIYVVTCTVSHRSLLTFQVINTLDTTLIPRETVNLLILTFFLIGTLSAAQIIKLFLSALSLSNVKGTPISNQSIGIIIGILERSIIILFVVGEAYSGVATVIALKTLSRFKSIEEDKEFAEYYLVGNLLSLAFSVVTGLLIRFLFIT